MKPIVAIPFKTQAKNISEEARAILRNSGFELICNETGKSLSTEELKCMIKNAFAVIAGTEIYDAEVLGVAEKLKTIIRFGVGTDNFDLPKMKEMGIKVGVIANYNAVAEFALGLMLSCYRQIPQHDEYARKAIWTRLPMREIAGKTVGIIGFGRIGQRLARLLSGFDSHVIAYDPYINEKVASDLNVESVSFDKLLRNSDIISLHLPSTLQTKHIIDRRAIDKMKKNVVIINTARGTLIDEVALYEALISGKVFFAGIDVYETEPVSADNLLLTLKDRTVVTPHAAASTLETNFNGGLTCVQSIINVFNGGIPVYPVKLD